MSDRYEDLDLWPIDMLDEPTQAEGPEIQDPFRDDNDDFDYEAYFNATRADAVRGITYAGDGLGPIGARHVDEERRTVPATPLFDAALKDREERQSRVAARGKDDGFKYVAHGEPAAVKAPGRAEKVKGILRKIRGESPGKTADGGIPGDTRDQDIHRHRGIGRGI